MKKLTLTNSAQNNTTVLENEFIDQYMIKANGEYVKVYLLLLRHQNEASTPLGISQIADILEVTEKDVIRALNYWNKQGLLEYESAETAPVSYTHLEDQLKMSLISEGRKIPVSQVSRGTIEQIYFALRMAAVDVLGLSLIHI